jgi:hypothetical protein
MGFARTLEENGVSDEDERIHEIRSWDQGPAAPLGRDPADVEFLLDVVTRLKEKERALEAELAWNWREGSGQRHVLQHIAEAQPTALKIIEENGFVFEDIGKEPGNWQHLAFTLYTEICEIDLSVRRALDIKPGEEV